MKRKIHPYNSREKRIDSKVSIQSRKKSLFYFDGKIDVSHLLTILAILVAYIALDYQRKDFNTKVTDLQKVVNDLQLEKRQRELQGLIQEEKLLKAESAALESNLEQDRYNESMMNQRAFESIRNLNYLLKFNAMHGKMSNDHKKMHELLFNRNLLSIEMIRHRRVYDNKRDSFDKRYEPDQRLFKSNEDYHVAMKQFLDTLKKNQNRLLNDLDKELNQTGNRLKKVETEISGLAIHMQKQLEVGKEKK